MDRDLGCSNNKQHRMDARPWTGGVFTGREKERSTIGDSHVRLDGKGVLRSNSGLGAFRFGQDSKAATLAVLSAAIFFRFVIRGYDVVSSERLAGGVLLLHAMQRALNAHSALGGTDQLWALGAHKDALMCIADTHIRQHMGGGKCTSEASPVHASSV